jgi:hypothetical protein
LLYVTAYRQPDRPGGERGPWISSITRRVDVPPLADSDEPVDVGNLVIEVPNAPPGSPPSNPIDDGHRERSPAPQPSQKTPISSAAAEGPAAGAPVQLETLDGLDVILLRGNVRDVARLVEVVKQLDALSPADSRTVERLNGLLLSQGDRAAVHDGKIVVAPMTVKFDFAFKSWSEVLESLAKQMDLSLVATSLPPGTLLKRISNDCRGTGSSPR